MSLDWKRRARHPSGSSTAQAGEGSERTQVDGPACWQLKTHDVSLPDGREASALQYGVSNAYGAD